MFIKNIKGIKDIIKRDAGPDNVFTDISASSYVLVMGAISVIFILGFSFLFSFLSEYSQTYHQGKSQAAYYLAEAGVERAIYELKNIFRTPLVNEKKEVNENLLKILDYHSAQDFQLSFADSEFASDSKYYVKIEFFDLKETPFGSLLREKEVPPKLEQYKKDTVSFANPKKLGGWQGKLKITAAGTVRMLSTNGELKDISRTLVVIRDIKVMDLTPIATEYTLFISGEKTEYIKEGEFILEHGLSNLIVIAQGFVDDFQRLLPYLKGSMKEMIDIVRDFVTKTKFTKPQEKKMEDIFKAYKVAGRVRTNGVVHIYLPFFDVDDIINYFVSNNYYERPEVGYPFCNNRLHDRFMSWATKFEGDIKKHYYELVPYVIQNQKPTPKVEQYTRWSTFPNYLKQYPNETDPENLKSLLQNAELYATEIIPHSHFIFGEKNNPYKLDGITLIKGDLKIAGLLEGRGILIVTDNIHVQGDIKLIDDKTLLTIVSQNGKIIIPQRAKINIQASVYAKDSIFGGEEVNVIGNYTVTNLNRQEGEDGKLLMPRKFKIKYDNRIRNIMGDNFWVSISKRDIKRYEIGGLSKNEDDE